MAIFSRKGKDKDYDYEDENEEYEDLRQKRLTKRKLKDLKSENRKKRKEPPKPWGRKERLLVFWVFFITVALSGVLALSARKYKLPGIPRISIPRFEWGSGTHVIESDDRKTLKAESVKNDFVAKTKNLSGIYAFYVVRLSEGFDYGINQNETMQAASLIKLPVMAAFYKEAAKGNVSLEGKYSLRDADKVGGAGSLYSKPAGTTLTYRELIAFMGKESDNTAFNVIRRALGDELIQSYIFEFGMDSTSLKDNKTTPRDIGQFFRKLWDGEIVSLKQRDEILQYLTDTSYENWLAEGISEVRVAHKYGREIHSVSDAGIVFSDPMFVLVIMSDGVLEKEADLFIPQMAKIVYESESLK